MIVKINNKVNFNFHKVQSRVIKQLVNKRLKRIADFTKKKVRDTFRKEKNIDGSNFQTLSEKYVEITERPNRPIMDRTGNLKKSLHSRSSIKTNTNEMKVSYGTNEEQYEPHLNKNGYKGKYGKVPQRKFFYTSNEEAFDIVKEKIATEVDEFLDDFIRNLSTSMRKL